jgi:hypothetical protein
MWVYLIAVVLLVFGLVGTVIGGGIFTIALIPIAFIVFGSAVVFGLMGRSAQGAAGASTDESHTADRPLPSSHQRPSGRAPTTPERLADSRRAQQ